MGLSNGGGLSKREWLAGIILQGLCSNTSVIGDIADCEGSEHRGRVVWAALNIAEEAINSMDKADSEDAK
jgi:hypothetical protein